MSRRRGECPVPHGTPSPRSFCFPEIAMARKRGIPEAAPDPPANLAGLVAACTDEPGDDGLRLILADYLEDHGEPERAEMIRLSVQVADRDPASVPSLHARLARLRRDHDGRWLGGIGGKGVTAGL